LRRSWGLSIPEFVILHHEQYQQLAEHLSDALEPAARSAASDAALSRVARHPAAWIDGFVTDDVLMAAAQRLGKRTLISPEISRRGNNKLQVHKFLEDQGFAVFDTETADSPDHVAAAAASLRAKGYQRVVVKAQIGASGIGMLVLDACSPEMEQVQSHLFFEGPCLVQGWLDDNVVGVRRVGSPSMQLFLDDTTVWLYDVTEQILSAESVHQGNIAPPPYWRAMPELEPQMREQSAAVGRWLHENGYRGTASADFLVIERAGRIEVRLCEVNARVTGATYPSVLARRFVPGGAWLMRNLTFDPPIAGRDLLGLLRRAGHLFADGDRGGVLPINFNADDAGLIRKGQFLCLGAEETECFEVLMHSADILPVKWAYDRD